MPDNSTDRESAVDLVRRAALAHLAKADELLSAAPRWSAETIHEIRKSVKRIRAALALIRSRIGDRHQDWDRRLRTVNRTLSAARDLDASIARLVEFSPRASAEEIVAIERLRLELAQRRVAAEREHSSATLRPLLTETIRVVQDGLTQWRGDTSSCLLGGSEVAHMVRQARRRIRRLAERPHSEDVHTLRKVVKLRLYWLEILQPIWPSGFRAEERLVDRLSERLGRHHDLEVLQDHLRSSSLEDDHERRPGMRSLAKTLRKSQRELERQALRLARRLFAERPKAFRRRWAAWEAIWLEAGSKSRAAGSSVAPVPPRPSRPR